MSMADKVALEAQSDQARTGGKLLEAMTNLARRDMPIEDKLVHGAEILKQFGLHPAEARVYEWILLGKANLGPTEKHLRLIKNDDN